MTLLSRRGFSLFITLAVLLFALAGLAAWWLLTPHAAASAVSTPTLAPTACKDASCLQQAVQNGCQTATLEQELNGVRVRLQTSPSSGACSVNAKIVSIDETKLSPQLQAEYEKAKPLLPVLLSQDMTCVIQPADAAKLTNPAYLQSQAFLDSCSGGLKTLAQPFLTTTPA